jgi:archaeal flagellar protein FlaF
MGLSIAISGAIMVFTMIYVMMSFPSLLDDTANVSRSSSEMSNTLNYILHTNIRISNLVDTHGTNPATFSVTNTGNTILWNYKKFDVIITYQQNGNGNTILTEALQYSNSCTGLDSDHWCISSITNDLTHPGMLDPNEIINVEAKVLQATLTNGNFILNFGTDNGILDTNSVKIT